MSSTSIIHLWIGEKYEYVKEFRNSFGSAPVVWLALGKKHVSPDYSMFADSEKLWGLWKRKDVPEHQRAVLVMTFDKAYVAKKDYQRAAQDIRLFVAEIYTGEGANHWPEIANYFASDPDVPAIGFHMTSVTENLFAEYDEEKDDYIPNWENMINVYEELDNIDS